MLSDRKNQYIGDTGTDKVNPTSTTGLFNMDQNLQPYDLGEGVKEASSGMRVTKNGQGGNCNQCDYTSDHTNHLRRHMETHSDEKIEQM